MRRRWNRSGRPAADGPRIEVIDRRSYDTMQRLAAPCRRRQVIGRNCIVHRVWPQSGRRTGAPASARGAEILGHAERKLRMALLLAEGGFAAEAMPRWMHAWSWLPPRAA